MEMEDTGLKEDGTPLEAKDLHAAFVTALKKSGEPRFGCLDMMDKVFFVSFSPDSSKVR